MLSEEMSANRIRASITPASTMDPRKAEILGKTLGELQDFRDLAHDESLKTEQVAREVATEKKSIRDRIAEVKAKIEYKKHLLDKLVAENRAQGKHQEGIVQIEGEASAKSSAATRVLLDDTRNQLDELYRLRDRVLSADTRGGPTVSPQVKLRIEERMAGLESKVDQEIEAKTRVAANLEENLGHTQRAIDSHNVRIEETKYTLNEIKRESEELDKDIEREIDSRNMDINENTASLKEVLKEKQDLKWKISSLESEVNKLEFQKAKLDVEVQARSLKDNKYDIIDKLNRRIEDAKYHEEHIKDLISHAHDINIDVGFIETIDIEGDRKNRLRELQSDLQYKKRNEDETREEIRKLNDQLRLIGEVNFQSKTFQYEESYTHVLQDLNIGYADIIQSVRDHLSANAAILRKEKEIKEMEARIALIDLEALEEEYERLRILYDRDSEILRDLEERYSLLHDRLIRLRARLRELNDLIRSLEERLETARFEISDAERKYMLIKVPPKIEYIVNERVEDVLIKKKILEKDRLLTVDEHKREKNKRLSSRIVGTEFYRPSEEELKYIIPVGSIVKVVQDGDQGYYRFGSKRFYFIKGNDGEMYVNHDGERMSFDDFISLYEATERSKAGRTNAKNVEHGDIEDEEMDAEVGDEVGKRTYKGVHKLVR